MAPGSDGMDRANSDRHGRLGQRWSKQAGLGAGAAVTHQARALEAGVGTGQEASPFLMTLSFILTAWNVGGQDGKGH